MSNHPFVPLRHRAVRLLWGAAVISDIGTWVQLIVVGSLVAAGTGSAVQTGLVALATFMPQGIASPLGGLLADRYDRRKVFAVALVAQATVTTALAVTLGLGVRTPWVLTLLILVGSAAGATGAPSYAAMLGSAMVLAVGPAWTIGFNAFSFVVMAAAVSLVRRPFRPHGAAGTVRERLLGGVHAMRSTPGCWHALVMLALFNTTIVPFMGLIPIYVQGTFDGGTGMVGIVASAQGIGAIIGGILVTMLAARYGRSTIVGWLAVTVSAALASYAVSPNLAWVVAVAMVLGGGWSSMFIALSAVIQRDAPPASRGRVMSLMQATLGVSYGSGLLFIGILGDSFNMRVAFGAGAAIGLVGFWVFTLRARHWRQAIDGMEVPTRQAELASC